MNPVFDNSVETSGTFDTFFVQGNQGPGFEFWEGGEHAYIYIYIYMCPRPLGSILLTSYVYKL